MGPSLSLIRHCLTYLVIMTTFCALDAASIYDDSSAADLMGITSDAGDITASEGGSRGQRGLIENIGGDGEPMQLQVCLL